ncbi:aggregation-promoting factor C-terminal-like domain-containing protein [Streptomyces lonarensis]|uniref:Lytic transglycosylase domain-containing protein n=1 Tax=Streptomyces lonarensis TaxID=700599 RepID=A0A7X6D0U4_9ACTN|nr:transglycosylase SLT domain-containing protein [Streptomyces lonarensis]NJQ05948.1 lytic transglycosylase domain-containing protein [Streptomyces lonarensis]
MAVSTTPRPRTSRAPRLVAAALAASALGGLGVVGMPGQAHGATAAPAVASSDSKDIAREVIDDDAQFACFSNIVERESSWDHTATNAASGAYGLVQSLPGDKMASEGADWRTNPETQIRWGVDYMDERYGSPCAAWSFWQANHWY